MTNLNYVKTFRDAADAYEESINGKVHDEIFGLCVQWTGKPSQHVLDLCEKLNEAADIIEDLYRREHDYEHEIEELKCDKYDLQQEIQDLKDEIYRLEK